jgi:hypothetical protein
MRILSVSAFLTLFPCRLGAAEVPYAVTVQDPGTIGTFHFSPDGQYFVHHTGYALQLWTRDGVLLREYDTSGLSEISQPDFLPGGQAFLASVGGGNSYSTLYRFGLNGDRTKLFQLPWSSSKYDAVRVFPDGKSCLLLPGMPSTDDPIVRYDLSGHIMASYKSHEPNEIVNADVRDFKISPDGGHFAFSYNA